MDENRVNAITCTTWVPQGVAKPTPEKIEITKEDLEKIIKSTSENLRDLEEVNEEEYTALEVEALEEDLKISSKKEKLQKENDVEMKDEDCGDIEDCVEETDDQKIAREYDFANYDTENDGMEDLFKLGRLTVHCDSAEDPNITIKEDDNQSDIENNEILPTDNLIVVGHIDRDAATLEVYVYNGEEGSLYVHHDILLPSIPLCMEWLNYDPEEGSTGPGNLVAIGSMSPIIEIWDLDLIDCLEPAYVLGRKAKKKKKIPHVGHSDAVLCLAWNKELDHILASGSVDKSIILWDLQECKEAQKMTNFTDKIQDLKWHGTDTKYLLAGSCDKTVKLFDCVSQSNCNSWKLNGEVESVVWDPSSDHPFNFFASTDTGLVYSFDSRQKKPLQTITAHEKSCTGMVMNSKCPGCLVTVSEDETVKIWDVHQPKAVLIAERNPKIGIIHTVSCSPDAPFALSLGGDNKMNNFSVWDIRQSKNVRRGFFDRLGLPIEDGENEEYETFAEVVDKDEDEEDAMANDFNSAAAHKSSNLEKWSPKKKSKKKKGGHIDKRGKR